MIKKCLLTLMLVGAVYTMTPAAKAQDSQTSGQPAQSAEAPQRGRGQFDPAKRTQVLTKKLNLTADQQTKVQDILTSAQSQMQSLRSNSSMSQDERHSKMMDIHKTSSDQIRALLDPGQQKKFDEMQARHQHEHGQGGQAPSENSGPSASN